MFDREALIAEIAVALQRTRLDASRNFSDDARELVGMIEATVVEERIHLQSTILAWQTAFDGIDAHIRDRMAMGDPAKPETYLAIIRADVERVLRDTKQIEASWWHDRKLANDRAHRAKEEMRERAIRALDALEAGGDCDNNLGMDMSTGAGECRAEMRGDICACGEINDVLSKAVGRIRALALAK